MRTIISPYPQGAGQIGAVSYISPLSLIRPPARLLGRLGEDGDYVLQHDYDILVEIDGERRLLTVPRGLITDLTSVPAILRWYVGRVGPWLEAAIVHDWLYVAWQVVDRAPDEADRAFADRLMLAAMRAAGIGPIRRNAIYGAVRLFGRGAYIGRNDPIFADLDARVYDTPLVVPTS
ncbi:DUF1353 domain-containing protein [Palleronia abyssalis]|uniref:DUF1353 domain-containing protein n=1 Tax=Palleronia abyssalis TaxID=1501240 RepID=A0A2R8BXR8_9RHOB|nr:DUF1353 domain-containing protein [Palleronia abyssalis]SPJ24977.1 hypothetical protein PAA8504_02820 [Palleronia abyssalis]